MTEASFHETFYTGGEAEAVFPIPFPFREPGQVTAEIVDAAGRAEELLPGLEYIVNRVSDAYGELILLDEELAEGETLRIRVADAGLGAGDAAAVDAAPIPEDCADDADSERVDRLEEVVAELRARVEAGRLDLAARLESLEAALGRRRGPAWPARLIRRLFGLARKIRALWAD